jgi:hypothetical protein
VCLQGFAIDILLSMDLRIGRWTVVLQQKKLSLNGAREFLVLRLVIAAMVFICG